MVTSILTNKKIILQEIFTCVAFLVGLPGSQCGCSVSLSMTLGILCGRADEAPGLTLLLETKVRVLALSKAVEPRSYSF